MPPAQSQSERKAPTSLESLKYTRTDIDESRRFLDVLAERDVSWLSCSVSGLI